jgi:Uma2 family endonuclease
VIYLAPARAARAGQRFTEGADLVMEVFSESNRDHDLQTKRREYAAAGIPEYWIVDPEEAAITVLALEPGASAYAVHGVFRPGDRASSALLPGFEVDVADALTGAS